MQPAPTGNFQAILIRSNLKLPEELVRQVPSVRMIATCGVGYDNLPLAYLKEQGIQASNTPGVLNDAVCELAIGMMLALLRKLPEAQEYVKSTAWSRRPSRAHNHLGRKTRWRRRYGAVSGKISQDV
ncbi:hypothetical protein [Polynucleobacter necessarius]|uniref:hypothetical protein n=1 Tax=Polynucleobacter necessarius TaxID=576610 RepID=UPI0018D56D3E|nr:hypothetical protein [Polynucleobacter necessarius]